MRSLTRSLCLSVCVFSGIESDWGRYGLGFDYAQECNTFKGMCTCRSRKESNLTVGTIQRKIVNRVNDTILRLYKCILRLQLEYYMQVIIAIYRTWKD